MLYFCFVLLCIWIIIYPGTDYWVRYFSSGTIKTASPQDARIYLTFDDGPNPFITPKVWDILLEHKIPATFFLVGFRAEQAPDLVRRMICEGHQIALHSYYHQHAYSMFFKKSIATIIKGKQVIENICSGPINLFRPPWGALNLFQYLLLNRLKLKIVLWSANAIDWDIKTSPAKIIERLRQKVKPGSIIVIHDAGGDIGAPENMLKALPEMIRIFKEQKFIFSKLN